MRWRCEETVPPSNLRIKIQTWLQPCHRSWEGRQEGPGGQSCVGKTQLTQKKTTITRDTRHFPQISKGVITQSHHVWVFKWNALMFFPQPSFGHLIRGENPACIPLYSVGWDEPTYFELSSCNVVNVKRHALRTLVLCFALHVDMYVYIIYAHTLYIYLYIYSF